MILWCLNLAEILCNCTVSQVNSRYVRRADFRLCLLNTLRFRNLTIKQIDKFIHLYLEIDIDFRNAKEDLLLFVRQLADEVSNN